MGAIVSEWYYEGKGERVGPVSEDDIKNLYLNGVLQSTSLVWTKEFGPTWKPLSETGLVEIEPAAPVEAEPVAEPSGPPPLPSSADQPDEFLASNLTEVLIGPKKEHYLSKWRNLLQKAGGDPTKVVKQTSWNWPAFFIPYGWLLYRKMYLLGGIIFALQAIYVLIPLDGPQAVNRAFSLAMFAISIVTAMYGNAWYFDATRKKWEALRNQADTNQALARAKSEGGVTLPLGLGSFAAVIGLVVVSFLHAEGVGIFASNVSCSSDAALNLVARIAREEIDKDSYMMFVVDSKATKVSVSAIRTRASDTQQAECAGEISYNIAFKAGQNDNTVKKVLETALNKPITYKVENTDDGEQIYVTVWGL